MVEHECKACESDKGSKRLFFVSCWGPGGTVLSQRLDTCPVQWEEAQEEQVRSNLMWL